MVSCNASVLLVIGLNISQSEEKDKAWLKVCHKPNLCVDGKKKILMKKDCG